eukprot:scaffold7092_cov262-Pinguiococcus_pyrenoidosus.AAC.27
MLEGCSRALLSSAALAVVALRHQGDTNKESTNQKCMFLFLELTGEVGCVADRPRGVLRQLLAVSTAEHALSATVIDARLRVVHGEDQVVHAPALQALVGSCRILSRTEGDVGEALVLLRHLVLGEVHPRDQAELEAQLAELILLRQFGDVRDPQSELVVLLHVVLLRLRASQPPVGRHVLPSGAIGPLLARDASEEPPAPEA